MFVCVCVYQRANVHTWSAKRETVLCEWCPPSFFIGGDRRKRESMYACMCVWCDTVHKERCIFLFCFCSLLLLYFLVYWLQFRLPCMCSHYFTLVSALLYISAPVSLYEHVFSAVSQLEEKKQKKIHRYALLLWHAMHTHTHTHTQSSIHTYMYIERESYISKYIYICLCVFVCINVQMCIPDLRKGKLYCVNGVLPPSL